MKKCAHKRLTYFLELPFVVTCQDCHKPVFRAATLNDVPETVGDLHQTIGAK